jgi:putative nucleotidyltransferase with HDIG domain
VLEAVRRLSPETYLHCVRVGRSSAALAKALGLNDFEQKIAEYSGLFHDIGKIKIDQSVLLKPGRLTSEEFAEMKRHSQESAHMLAHLSHVPFFRDVIEGVLFHHERFDGQGYPDGLRGEEIPTASRIVLVADAFDAMTADRVYRKGLSAEYAERELIDCSGTQFDGLVVKDFLRIRPESPWEANQPEFHRQVTHLKKIA